MPTAASQSNYYSLFVAGLFNNLVFIYTANFHNQNTNENIRGVLKNNITIENILYVRNKKRYLTILSGFVKYFSIKHGWVFLSKSFFAKINDTSVCREL